MDKRFTDLAPHPLPQPEIIATARRNIHTTEFHHYVQSKYPASDNNAFIGFIDKFLSEFGKGMAYVYRKCGPINPSIGIGTGLDGFASDSRQDWRQFPQQKKIILKLDDKPRTPHNRICSDVMPLTDHRSSQNHTVFLTLEGLHELYKKNPVFERNLLESTFGKYMSLKRNLLYIGLGAHEAFHLYDRSTNSQFNEEYKSYSAAEGASAGNYIHHPIEERAHSMAQEAVCYYSRLAKSIDSLSKFP